MDQRTTRPESGSWARGLNLVLGIWLFISAFLWPHGSAQMTNTWVVGLVAAGVALIGVLGRPQARYLNTVVSVWLLVSAFALPSATSATVWNNAIIAIVMFVVSLVPEVSAASPRTFAHHA